MVNQAQTQTQSPEVAGVITVPTMTIDMVEALEASVKAAGVKLSGQLAAGEMPDAESLAAMATYGGLVTEAKNARLKLNESAISTARASIGEAIEALIVSTELANLKGERIESIVYQSIPDDMPEAVEGEEPPAQTYSPVVLVNVKVTRGTGTRTARAPSAGRDGARDLESIFNERATADDLKVKAQIDAGVNPKNGQPFNADGADDAIAKKRAQSAFWNLKNKVAKRVVTSS